MNDAPTPALVVDIGGTLLRRTEPGALERTLRWLAVTGFDQTDLNKRLVVARAVLTSPDPATAAAAVVSVLGLDVAARATLVDLFAAPDGHIILADGAAELLAAARQHGWRVIAATNAARWASPLPSVIARHFDRVICSADVGLIKQEQTFWELLLRTVGIERRWTLAVGDNMPADIEPAWRLGIAAIHVDQAIVTAALLVPALRAVGPAPSDAIGLVAGPARSWAGRWVTSAPQLQTLVRTVTRAHVLVQTKNRVMSATVVRRRKEPPAVCCDRPQERPPLLAWLRERPDHRWVDCPSDLASALNTAGLPFASLPIRDQRHIVSLVREAKDPAVRIVRITDIVNHLRSLDPEK